MGFVNRALGALLALALIVAGGVALLEIGALLVGSKPLAAPHDRWLAELTTQPWSGRPTRLVCTLLAATGLALIGLQLLRQRPAQLAAAAEGPLPTSVGRHDLEREVAAELGQIQGVDTTRVKLRRRGLDVQATAVAGDPAALRDELALAARAALSARGVDASGPAKVVVRRQPARRS